MCVVQHVRVCVCVCACVYVCVCGTCVYLCVCARHVCVSEFACACTYVYVCVLDGQTGTKRKGRLSAEPAIDKGPMRLELGKRMAGLARGALVTICECLSRV